MSEDLKAILNLQESSATSEPRFTKRDFLWLSDQNIGSYTNQIQIDTQSTANNNQYVLWSDAYIQIPMTITTVASGTTEANPGALAVCFKQPGFAALVNSVLITINGVAVNNQASNLATLINYRLMTDLDRTKLDQIGQTIGFYPDTSDSFQQYGTGTGAPTTAIGMPNNAVTSVYTATATQNIATWLTPTFLNADQYNYSVATGAQSLASCQNKGAQQRAKWLATNWNINQTSAAAFPVSSLIGRNIVTITAATGGPTTGIATYNVMGIIRLKDLHACFAAMDMPIRNARIQLQINLNGPINGIMQGTSNPLMLTDQASGIPPYANGGPTATGITSATIKIGTYNGINQATRLYFPTVQMPAAIERNLVSWKRLITFWDHQQFYLANQGQGTQVNWLVTNGVQNLRRVWIIPYVTAASYNQARNIPASVAVAPYNAYSTTEPGTASPNAALTAIQLMVNGKNFYANVVNFGFEQFIHETVTEVMGGFSEDAVVSGLFNQYDWQQAPAYVFNVSRNPDIATSEVPCSVQFIAQNASPFAIDLLCLLEYETGFELDQSSTSLNVTMSRPPILQS